MNTDLQLGDDLVLPVDLVSRRTTVLGQTDTGKTSTAVVIVEEAAAAGAQFVVLDPTGAWWGLTSSAAGDRAGVDCVVMGGKHGDMGLDEHAGHEVARLIADEGYSLVLDLDGLKSWAARQRFVADFCSELYERAHSQILVVMDEAHRLAPQGRLDDTGFAARCLGAVSDVVLLGRRRGLGTLMVCQRPAKLHKDVLEMSEVLIAHRVRGNNDRKALQGWVEEADLDVKALMTEISGLAKGVARVSAPTLGINATYTIRPKWTFDSSKSIGVGEVALEPKKRAHVNMDELRDRMAVTIERTKAEDPKELQKLLQKARNTVDEEKEIAYDNGYRQGYEKRAELDAGRIVEVPALNEDELVSLTSALQDLRQSATEVSGNVALLQNALDMAQEMRSDAAILDLAPLPAAASPSAPVVEDDAPVPAPRAAQRPPSAMVDPGVAARDILTALSCFDEGLTTVQISLLTGRRPKGGSWNTAIKQIRDGGYVAEDGGKFFITVAGRLQVPDAAPLSQKQIVSKWRSSFPSPAQDILDVMMKADAGSSFELTKLAEMTGRQPRGGSWNTAMKALRDSGLVVVNGTSMKINEDILLAT